MGRMGWLGLADRVDVLGDWSIEMRDSSFPKRKERNSWQGASGAFVGDEKVWRTAAWGCRDAVGDDVKESDPSRRCDRVCTAKFLDTEGTETGA